MRKPDIEIQLAHWLQTTYGNVFDDSASATARRLIEALREFVPGERPRVTLFSTPVKDQMIIERDIEFASLCCHHLFPFFGKVHIGYISDGQLIGLSKLPRLVEWVARRPTTQERLTSDLVKELRDILKPKGVIVVVDAVHTCVSCRGVRKVGASTVTSLPWGAFLISPPAKEEFFANLRLK